MPDFKPGDAVWVKFFGQWDAVFIDDIDDREIRCRYPAKTGRIWIPVKSDDVIRPRDPALEGKDKPQ